MKYYKASITIENSQKKYGNLPIGFVLGYENSNLNEAYFCLYEQVNIPNDADIVEISKEEYDTSIEMINKLETEKRKNELDETIKIVEQKQKVIENINKSVVSLESENADLNLKLAQSTIETIEFLTLLNEQQKIEQAQSNTEMIELLMMMQGGM